MKLLTLMLLLASMALLAVTSPIEDLAATADTSIDSATTTALAASTTDLAAPSTDASTSSDDDSDLEDAASSDSSISSISNGDIATNDEPKEDSIIDPDTGRPLPPIIKPDPYNFQCCTSNCGICTRGPTVNARGDRCYDNSDCARFHPGTAYGRCCLIWNWKRDDEEYSTPNFGRNAPLELPRDASSFVTKVKPHTHTKTEESATPVHTYHGGIPTPALPAPDVPSPVVPAEPPLNAEYQAVEVLVKEAKREEAASDDNSTTPVDPKEDGYNPLNPITGQPLEPLIPTWNWRCCTANCHLCIHGPAINSLGDECYTDTCRAVHSGSPYLRCCVNYNFKKRQEEGMTLNQERNAPLFVADE